MTLKKSCICCNQMLPVTREYFGNTASGNFRGKCRKCMAAHTAAHTAANRNQMKERLKRRKDLEYLAGEKPRPEDIEKLRMIQKNQCAYCMCTLYDDFNIDHIKPISKLGQNNFENLALACSQCNKEKHSKNLEEYLRWRNRLGLPIYTQSYAYIKYMEQE